MHCPALAGDPIPVCIQAEVTGFSELFKKDMKKTLEGTQKELEGTSQGWISSKCIAYTMKFSKKKKEIYI